MSEASGTTNTETATKPEDWIRASEVLRAVAEIMGDYKAPLAIARRAHGGMIRTRAKRLVLGDRAAANDVEIPAAFWWAEGREALEQDWPAGDFETWIDKREHWRAYGVSFLRSHAAELAPSLAAPAEVWVRSKEAVILVANAIGQEDPMKSLYSIITYAKAGRIRGRALHRRETRLASLSSRKQVEEYVDAEVPKWFWDECTGYDKSALDWRSGVYAGKGYFRSTSIDVLLTGVEFEARGLALLAPNALPPAEPPTTSTGAAGEDQGRSGRRMSQAWPEWVAELAVYLHQNGIPPGIGVQGQDGLISAVADGLAERGLDSPSRTTVQATVKAVLARLRSA